MHINRSFLLLCGLLLLSCTTSGFEYPCTYKSKAGDFYDLSPLSLCDHSGWQVPTVDESFSINVCNTVMSCGGSSGSCQGSSYNAGVPANATFSDLPGGGKGLVMTYGGGDAGGCPGNKPRSTVFSFICNATSGATPNFVFVSESPTCAYNFQVYTKYACPIPSAPQLQTCPTYVYLVPHTHDDVGWILTIEGYYQSEVKHILDTVTASLIANPQRKFIYVEQAFFYLWWTDVNTNDTQRQQLKTLVKNGQFEFVIGGWVMQDEACTTYGADIDQMTQGHQFLLNTFGVTPTKGWQLDPFGASSVTPTLNKLSGFDAHLIDRITGKAAYETSQRLEFVWKGSPSLGDKAAIFTNIMDGGGGAGYCNWFSTFNFENDPVNAGNVASWGQKFITMVNQRSPHVRTPHMLAAWGCDFSFQNAHAMFNSMDKVVAWLQSQESQTHIYVKYATVSDYFAAVMATPNIAWPVNQAGDFFPYFDSLWWTGYFTSRVQLKGVVRQGEAVARAAEPIYALGRTSLSVDASFYNQLNTLRVANADAQHHDGVTGTSEPDVVDMYTNDLLSGINAALSVTAKIFAKMIQKGTQTVTLSSSLDSVTNIKAGQTQALVLYNSLGWTRNDIITIPINRNNAVVTDASNNKLPIQYTPTASGSSSTYLLTFPVSIGPLGWNTYFITAPSTDPQPLHAKEDANINEPNADILLQNNYLSVTISGTTGLITKITNKKSGASADVNQNVEWYLSQHSGAYAFGPAGPSKPLSATKPPQITLVQGPIVDTVYQTFPCDDRTNSYAKQAIRLYHSTEGTSDIENYIELSYVLGPLPSAHELVATFNTSIFSGGVFATDENGFEFQERLSVGTVPIEGNYYPMVYATYIRDNFAQLSVISERSHGAGSIASGELEVMIHRNPDMGDPFGPGLTDTTTVYPVLRVILDTPINSPQAINKQTYLMNFPITVFTAAATTPAAWSQAFSSTGQLLAADLPVNVHLLALNALDATSKNAILRLTHLFAIREDLKYSTPVTVDVVSLLKQYKIATFVETTLTANAVIDKKASTMVTLQPKDIRTFIVGFA